MRKITLSHSFKPKNFVSLLKSPHHKRRTSTKTVRFRTLRRANSSSPKSLRQRSMKIITCASGFKANQSPRKKKKKKDDEEEEEGRKITDKDKIDTDSIRYVYNPFGSVDANEDDPLSLGDSIREPVPFPTPITPSLCVSMTRIREEDVALDDEAEEACWRFENYLVEMMAEDGKIRDLVDVEEFVKGWNQLKNPVYVQMVCRFYIKMCKDLFCGEEEDDDEQHHDDNDGVHVDDEDDDVETRSCPGAIYV